jgi:hypothetical protein
MFEVECPKCHEKNKSGSRYCGGCGERLPGSEIKCGNCGAVVAGNKKFCGVCGKPLVESEAPLLTGNRWARREDDFATKVEVTDVEGFFKKGLIVEAGTKAIFFVNGAYSGILEPGKYDMGGLVQRIKNVFNSKTTTAVLVDTGDVEMKFSLAELQTKDPIRLSAECKIVVQMDNPTQFFENMMKGRQNYSLSQLKSFLEDEIRNCMMEFIGARSVQELSTNLACKQQMEQGIAAHLAKTFDRKGLSFVQARVFDFRHPHVNALTKKMEEYWLHAEDLKVRLAGQEVNMQLERRLLDQETAQTIMQLEVYEDRARVRERMRKAVAGEKMSEISSEADMEKFLLDMDRQKLLRADEMRDLAQTFAEKGEDHDLARKHIIQKLKVEQDMDLARAALMGKIALQGAATESVRNEEMAQLEHELAAKRKTVDLQQAQEWAVMEQEVRARRLQAENEQDLEKRKKLMDVELEEKETQADTRSALDALRIVKEQKAMRKEEEDADLERRIREKEVQHRQELEKIDKLANLSTEALIALGPADRAPILAELQKSEKLKGLTAEQILAMAADKSPEVAKAFQEKYKNSTSEEVEKAYERMLAIKEKSEAEFRSFADKAMDRMQDMYRHGMETQRDTAVAAARSGQPETTVITPGSGILQSSGPYGQPIHEVQVVICPDCRQKVPAGNKFCDGCGHKF